MIDNDAPTGRSAAAVFEVLDTRGNAVVPASETAISKLPARASMNRGFTPPATLSDGFYQLRATAVASDKKGSANVSANAYFEVRDGSVRTLGLEEFMTLSKANVGISQ